MPNAVAQGLELGCEAIQVFTRNQRQWFPKPLDIEQAAAFRLDAAGAGFHDGTVSHASYLINLCATDPAILEKSRMAFIDELERCAALGIPYLCVHPGSHVGAGEDAGLAGIIESLKEVLAATRGKKVMVLLENTAGQGTNLGHRLEHLETLLKGVRSKRVGICIDTCHFFAAGYDIASKKGYDAAFLEVESRLGLDRVRAFHLNDSKFPLGSRKDRHEHIGEGEIGAGAFRRLVNDPRFRDHPGLLETPGGPEGYERNLAVLRRMRKR